MPCASSRNVTCTSAWRNVTHAPGTHTSRASRSLLRGRYVAITCPTKPTFWTRMILRVRRNRKPTYGKKIVLAKVAVF